MAMNCYECGSGDHLARDCPNVEHLGNGHPMWCGRCDQKTRHYYADDGRLHRCQCHGLSHLSLPQHRRCASCKATIYAWDSTPCGSHAEPGQPRVYVGIEPKHAKPKDHRTLALAQAAESRAARIIV